MDSKVEEARAPLANAITLPTCGKCGTTIPYSVRECVGCGHDVGFPNVRAAERAEEVFALRQRVEHARITARSRSCDEELEAFGTAVLSSHAVLAKNLIPLDGLLANENQLLVSYYKLVRGPRIPENNEFDINRIRIDSLVNPYGVHEDIQFAALSLNNRGCSYYGSYHITLKDLMIETRSAVFEENPFIFSDKHRIGSRETVPTGYRASWPRRAELAMAKLQPRVSPGMGEEDFPRVLLDDTGHEDSDFIEVHIYGPIHARAIERVIGPTPRRKADQIIWKSVKRSLEKLGAEVQEV